MNWFAEEPAWYLPEPKQSDSHWSIARRGTYARRPGRNAAKPRDGSPPFQSRSLGYRRAGSPDEQSLRAGWEESRRNARQRVDARRPNRAYLRRENHRALDALMGSHPDITPALLSHAMGNPAEPSPAPPSFARDGHRPWLPTRGEPRARYRSDLADCIGILQISVDRNHHHTRFDGNQIHANQRNRYPVINDDAFVQYSIENVDQARTTRYPFDDRHETSFPNLLVPGAARAGISLSPAAPRLPSSRSRMVCSSTPNVRCTHRPQSLVLCRRFLRWQALVP